jgi:hypothetical protein
VDGLFNLLCTYLRTFVHKARCCEASETGNDTLVALGKEGVTTAATVFYSALEVPTCGGGLVNEAQEETKVRSRITVWSVALGVSLAVAYFYLLLLLGTLSSGRDLFSLSFHWLSASLLVAAVLQYLWFRRVARELGRYWILAVIGIHVLGVLGAILIFTIMLVGALFQM